MAERFVIGWSIDSETLAAVVGGGEAANLLAAVGDCDEVDDLLSERGDPITAADAIGAIASGELDPARAYEYRRVLELIADAIGRRFPEEIDVVLTYYLPNDSHGRWNPVLDELGLARLAATWGESSSFPFADGASHCDWPIAMLVGAEDAKAIGSELAALAPSAIASLRDDLLVDGGDNFDPGDTRSELAAGLATLATWFADATARGDSVLLTMDGNQ